MSSTYNVVNIDARQTRSAYNPQAVMDRCPRQTLTAIKRDGLYSAPTGKQFISNRADRRRTRREDRQNDESRPKHD